MSLKDNPCRKFQANIFNKSKCQNCFKPRESHLLNDEDLNQAKPIYAGWLLLAPEGTNFDNPLHRSRKWQRRFFILYEHGLLRYALDEMPSTLPQGTINMNQCSDVIDGESRTGQKNSLCILTPEKEYFIRAECKEIINGWQEALTVYPRTNKQNQKKKRKVDPPTHQEPGPAKVTRVPMSRATLWQEEPRWSRATIPCSRSASCLSHGYFSLEKTKSEPSPQSAHHSQPPQHLPLSSSASSSSLGAPSSRYNSESEPQTSPHQPSQDPLPSPGSLVSPSYSTISSSQSSLDSDPSGATSTWEGHNGGGGGRVGCSGREYAALADVPRARRLSYREAFRSEKKRQDLRARTRSPGREEVPDLLNFKKGWMTKLYEDGVWKKHWFVLTDQTLRYYKDSIAEEASEMDGEIDLSTCYDVKEFPVQRNYGFQILCKEGACTLSAMTSGIRRNWIQAIMKNVRPTIAPDVTRSLPDEKIKSQVMLDPDPSHNPEIPKSDGQRQPSGNNASAPASEPRKSRVRERRREGRSKTFDWTEFKMERKEKPVKERADTVDLSSSSTARTPNTVTVTVISTLNATSPVQQPTPGIQEQGKMEVDHPAAISPASEDKDSRSSDVQDEIEQRWHQVETTPLREEKQVPITTLYIFFGYIYFITTPCAICSLPLLREQSAREGYVLQATCERGFAAMEETHQKVIEDLQRQHQREISKLMEERERLLAEETAATIAAIEAMKNAHKEELEKTQRSQISGLNSDIDELRLQYEEELQSIQRELEVLSEQYSQKCLENAHLAQALEAERQALRQCQRENQELNAHNQELNNRLTVEISRMRSCFSGETAHSSLSQGKDVYELEVLLRIKESEIQYLKQEIHSLKDELQSALRDKKYATDKYKDIYTELSIVKAKADCDISKLKEKLLIATEALGERTVDGTVTSGYDIMKSKSNPDFMKKEQSASSRHSRGLRSKVSVCRVVCCFCGRNVFRVSQRSCFTGSASSVSSVCFIRQSVTEQVSWDS
uniref:PH domain-containing protein n=1 Tax=Astatotilapia calliptera TaxID=8154 RepID=A0AAX7UA21_ASTCA